MRCQADTGAWNIRKRMDLGYLGKKVTKTSWFVGLGYILRLIFQILTICRNRPWSHLIFFFFFFFIVLKYVYIT